MRWLTLLYPRRVVVFLKYQELSLSCKKWSHFEHYLSLYVDKVNKKAAELRLATDKRISRDRRLATEWHGIRQKQKISHGISRNFTEKTEAEERTSRRISHGMTRKRHGIRQKQKISHGISRNQNTSWFGLVNGFKAHGLCSMGYLFLIDEKEKVKPT